MKRCISERIFDKFNVLFMLVLSLIMIYPYLNQIAISLNEGSDTSFGGITIWPRKFTFANYSAIFSNDGIMNATVITVIVVLSQTALALLVCAGAAYALTKKELPYRNFLTWFLIIPMYISAGLIPTYILFRYLGLLSNIMVYIVPWAFSFYNMIVIRTFLKSIPISLEESAFLEGANEVQVLFKIVLPLCMPVIATVALWVSVGAWNSWTTTLMFINKSSLFTLQYVIMQIIKQSEVAQKLASEAALTGTKYVSAPTSESLKAASIIFSTIPIVMVYPFLQKYFVKGVTIGAIKD